MDKKGQLQNLTGFIIALVLAAIILVMGLIMTQTLQSTIDGVNTGVTNDSFNAMSYETNITVGEATLCDFEGFGVTTLWQLVDGVVVNTSAYTVYPNDGNIILTAVAGSTQNNTHMNATTTYSWGDEACVAANQTTAGLGTFGDFWEIIVLAIVVAVVLGLLVAVFGGKRRR